MNEVRYIVKFMAIYQEQHHYVRLSRLEIRETTRVIKNYKSPYLADRGDVSNLADLDILQVNL